MPTQMNQPVGHTQQMEMGQQAGQMGLVQTMGHGQVMHGQEGGVRPLSHPAILQPHEQQLRLQQQQGGPQVAAWQQQDGGQFVRPAIQQQQPGQPVIQNPGHWGQQQQPPTGTMQQPRVLGPAQSRPMSPLMQRQQQIIQQHIQQLTQEQRNQFSAMNAREKQQYLAQRGLLLPNPGQPQWGQNVQLQRHTIQLTEQQRQVSISKVYE